MPSTIPAIQYCYEMYKARMFIPRSPLGHGSPLGPGSPVSPFSPIVIVTTNVFPLCRIQYDYDFCHWSSAANYRSTQNDTGHSPEPFANQ